MRKVSVAILVNVFLLGYSFPTGSSSGNKLRDVDWWKDEQEELTRNLMVGLKIGMAKNVILFIGDGMGGSTVTAARVLKAQQDGKNFHETKLAWEDFPFTSISKTYNVDQLTPDSAGTATALLSGVKNNHGMIGVSQKAIKGKCSTLSGNKLKSLLDYSDKEDKWTGVVTTARITHATPAAAYASSVDRDWEADSDIPESDKECKDIARQLVEDKHFIRVLFGGGRRNFIPTNETDPECPTYKTRREDGRNLMKEWEQKQTKKVGQDKVSLVTNNTAFNAVDFTSAEYVMGLFEPSHMQYELDRDKEDSGEPSLAELTEKAIKMLSRSEKGYFLLIEGGRIDHAHHGNKAKKALTETIAMSEAVAKAASMTSEADTLLITTADHSHVFTIAGYPAPESDILGLSHSVITGTKDDLKVETGDDDLPYLPLSYGNGPGYLYHRTNGSDIDNPLSVRRNLTQDELEGKTRDNDYRQDAAWYRESETHGAEDVVVYARGPMSHLFHGTHEQTYISHVMMYASCVGPNQKHCTNSWIYPGCVNGASETKVAKGLIVVIAIVAVLRRLF